MQQVVDPFLRELRPRVGLVAYSLPGKCDPIRKKLYRSFDHEPEESERAVGQRELAERLKSFDYRGEPLPQKIKLSTEKPVVDYFAQFRGLDAGPRYNNKGFWDLPIPVASRIQVQPRDVAIFDQEGYPALKKFLVGQGIRHVLLAGYNTDMCVCKTTAGYENLARDFNVFLVGDATLATFPAHDTPRFATTAAVSFASLDLLITQVSWVKQ
jgi:hypothetical protein